MAPYLGRRDNDQAFSNRIHTSLRVQPSFQIQRPSNRINNVSPWVHPGRTSNHLTAISAPPPRPGVVLKSKEPWQDWLELSVKIHNLPSDITTLDLWERFQREGDISFIEIYENNRGDRDGYARIRFAQPPAVKPFWKSMVTIATPHREGLSVIKVDPEGQKRSFQIQSPVRKHIWYPELMSLVSDSLSFGLMQSPDTMIAMRTIRTPTNRTGVLHDGTGFSVDLLRNKVTIKFTLAFNDPRPVGTPDCPFHTCDRVSKYMFQVPFSQLRKIGRTQVDDAHWALIFTLDSPPIFHRKRIQEDLTHKLGALQWTEMDTWLRQTDIVYNPSALKTTVITLNKDNPVIDIGRWTTYKLTFKIGKDELSLFELMARALGDWNIEVVDIPRLNTTTAARPTIWSLIDPVGSNNSAESTARWFDGEKVLIPLPFEVRYQLEVCISQGYINEHNIGRDFIDRLGELAKRDSVKARTVLEYVAEQEARVYDPMSIFESQEALEYSPSSNVPHYCAYARKATITPSLIYFSTPSVETTNRVIRHYSAFGDRFLRVQFTDEKAEGRINSCSDKARNDEIFSRVYRTLSNGIQIGDRHYEFLAFGNSQFRENGAYFFCPHEHLTCNDIRRWMGNFSDIKVVAKYAARLGLCFSTTRAIHSARVKTVKLDDIERNGYCFTDGVGKISNLLANLIAQDLNLPSDAPPPSAFQFRMGGCKGILAVSPEVKGQEVYIRKSQQKFTAVYNGLEIIRCSHFSVAALNRQTITILSCLGVPDEVFNRMLVEQLSNYQAAMKDRSLALNLLGRYIDDNQMTMTIAGMVVDGFMDSNEPFLTSLLLLWRSWSIKLLKEKAKIIVEKGAFLLGVVDETGTLKGQKNGVPTASRDDSNIEDLPEIFLQVPDKNQKGRYIVVTGVCLLGRNPSLHPGDIRVVRAVEVPALKHLRDVVVFPQQGDRDIPSMCSGGDLDGDDFFVIWDEDLLPKEWNVQPMKYTAPEATELDRPVEIQDLMKFFVRYMKNDSLPTIAHAHLAQSDYLDCGVKHQVCLRLAELHSKAVDYVKTGEKAEMEKELRPKKWPHFMEKKYKRKEAIYVSEKILGQLYDKVESIDFVPQYELRFDRRILNAFPADDNLLKEARQMKTKYDTAMKRIMAQQEIGTEFEVWSTFVLSKPRVGSDYKVQEVVSNISSALKARFRQNCIELVGSKEHDILAPFVAAMYRVTYEEMQIALHECRTTKTMGGREVPRRSMEPKYMPLISFPWLFHDTLGRIATGLQEREELEELSLLFPQGRPFLKKNKTTPLSRSTEDDYLETEEGVVHRGEELDLFRPDDLDSDGDQIEQPDDLHHLVSVRSASTLETVEKMDVGHGSDISRQTSSGSSRNDLLTPAGSPIDLPSCDFNELKAELSAEPMVPHSARYLDYRDLPEHQALLSAFPSLITDSPLPEPFNIEGADKTAAEADLFNDSDSNDDTEGETRTVAIHNSQQSGYTIPPVILHCGVDGQTSSDSGEPPRAALAGSPEVEEEEVVLEPISSFATQLAKLVYS